MAAHARLKNEFMEDEKYHNLMTLAQITIDSSNWNLHRSRICLSRSRTCLGLTEILLLITEIKLLSFDCL